MNILPRQDRCRSGFAMVHWGKCQETLCVQLGARQVECRMTVTLQAHMSRFASGLDGHSGVASASPHSQQWQRASLCDETNWRRVLTKQESKYPGGCTYLSAFIVSFLYCCGCMCWSCIWTSRCIVVETPGLIFIPLGYLAYWKLYSTSVWYATRGSTSQSCRWVIRDQTVHNLRIMVKGFNVQKQLWLL